VNQKKEKKGKPEKNTFTKDETKQKKRGKKEILIVDKYPDISIPANTLFCSFHHH